jgi:uncharacterized protein YceK
MLDTKGIKNKKHLNKNPFNKKVVYAVATIIIGSMLLSGCGSVIPDMTQDEEEAVGEYAAMVLLKYDANHRSRLVDLSLVEEKAAKELEAEEKRKEEEKKKEEENKKTATEDRPGSDIPVVDGSQTAQTAGSIAEFLELPDGISITYSGMKVCDSYPDDGQAGSFFSLDASSGKKLLVLNFQMSNNSGADQDINIFEKNPVCKVTVNDSYTRTALMTMLTNDLSTYMGTLKAGASEEVVLLIEIDESMASSVSSVSMTLKNTESTYTETY